MTLIPKRAACLRSMVKLRFGWPISRYSLTSVMPGMRSHDGDDFFALLLESPQVVAVDLERQLTFGAGDRLSDVVFDRLREVPGGARQLFHLAIHGGDQFVLVLVKDRPPLRLRLEIDEVFRVPESAGVGSVIGTSDLRDDLDHFRETTRRSGAPGA